MFFKTLKRILFLLVPLILIGFKPSITHAMTPKQFYDTNGTKMLYDKSRKTISFAIKNKAAENNAVWYYENTGWQVVVTLGGKTFYSRFGMDGGANSFSETEMRDNEYTYSLFDLPLTKLINTLKKDHSSYSSTFDLILTEDADTQLFFDQIANVRYGSTSYGRLNSDRTINGQVYLTLDGSYSNTSAIVPSGFQRKTTYDDENGVGALQDGNDGWIYNVQSKGFRGAMAARYVPGWHWARSTFYGLSDNYNRKVTIYKTDKEASRTLTTQHIDTSTGKKIKVDETDTRTVTPGSSASITKNALSLSGYTYNRVVVTKGTTTNTYYTTSTTISLDVENENNKIIFYYTPKSGEGSSNSNGNIKFNPNSSNWSNSNINVGVSISGDKEITKTSYAYRSYTGSDGATYSILHPFTEKWTPSGLSVWGKGKNINGTEQNLTTQSISDGGTYSISNEYKEITLTAKIIQWNSSSKSWNSGNPPNGSWGTGGVTSSTTRPTVNYETSSGKYYIDKTKPKVESINTSSSGWTKDDKSIEIKMSDNLSGLQSGTSLKLVDQSYLKKASADIGITSEGISNDKHNYSSSVTINKDGIYKIEGTLTDNAGNSHNVSYKDYKIDKTVPYDTKFSVASRSYLDDAVNVTITVQDNLSGVAKVEYVVSKANTNPKETKINAEITTSDDDDESKTFRVKIDKNGEWYIHTWVTDRAGNSKYNVSPVYKYYKINSNDITINPTSNSGIVLRGSRFDVITKMPNFKDESLSKLNLIYTVPLWVDDDIDKKTNGAYAITSGTVEKITKNYTYSDDESIYFWDAYIPPYGTPLTLNNEGRNVGSKQKIKIILRLVNDNTDNPKETSPIEKEISIAPEQKINTSIINNQ